MSRMIQDYQRLHICPTETALEMLSGRWKPRILWKIYQQEVVRFGDMIRRLPVFTPKMLTQQLRELEEDVLVLCYIYTEVPPKVEYSLSEFGKTLQPILDTIANWGESHHSQIVEILGRQPGKSESTR